MSDFVDVLGCLLFDNKLSDEDMAKRRPQWGNGNLAQSMDKNAEYLASKTGQAKKPVPESITLTYPDGHKETFPTANISTGAWSTEQGGISLKLQARKDTDGDDFAV